MEATEDDKRLLMSRPPLIATQEHPWLLIHHGKHGQLETFYSISEDRCYVRQIPQLCYKYICASHASGWLVVEDRESDECFLFNLVSMEKIQLPPRISEYAICVLTSPPTDEKNCRVVFVNESKDFLEFCRPGDSEFVKQHLEHDDRLQCATSFEGKFYGIRQYSQALVVLDFTTPKPQFKKIISGERLCNMFPPLDICQWKAYIIESCGELLLVRKMWHGLYQVFGFSVFKADFFGNTWVELKSISEKTTIYLDSHDAMCISATKYGRFRGNCIYFTEVDDRCLYVFNLENQRISLTLPSATVSRSHSMRHWVMMPTKTHSEVLICHEGGNTQSMDDEKACSSPRETEHEVSLIPSQDPKKMEAERSCSDLQPEILSLIISNLFLWDSSNFNATCRSWKSILPPFPPPIESRLSKLPYLMVLNGSDCKFFQPLRNEIYQKKISELKNARIRFSKYGWLLMSQGENSLFFFNPFTKVKIELPDLPWLTYPMNVSFFSLPTSSDCTVVVLGLGYSKKTNFCIINRGEDKWTCLQYINTEPFVISDASPVFYNGKLYCLGETGNVGVLDLSCDGWSWDVCCKPLSRWRHYKYRQSFMVKCQGGILVVFVSHEDRRVEIKKLKLPEIVWEDVESLGDKMLYVSHEACLLENAVKEGMSNKIYFSKFHGDIGIFYSLDTRMYHSITGDFACRTSFNLAEQRCCTWIKAIDRGNNLLSTVHLVKDVNKSWLDL